MSAQNRLFGGDHCSRGHHVRPCYRICRHYHGVPFHRPPCRECTARNTRDCPIHFCIFILNIADVCVPATVRPVVIVDRRNVHHPRVGDIHFAGIPATRMVRREIRIVPSEREPSHSTASAESN